MNRQISAKLLEQIVWDKTLKILRDPDALIEGYRQSMEQQMMMYQKKRAYIETLERNLLKIKAKKQKLNVTYLDPDFEMPKHEYLEQKAALDGEAKNIDEDLATTYLEVNNIPVPADLETLQNYAAEITRGIEPVEKLTPEKKRDILRMLHITVRLSPSGDIELGGWFNVTEKKENDETGNDGIGNTGLLSQPSTRYARPLLPLPGRA
jgi:hypothetical protein